jgi:hypothetical protein
MAPQLIDQTDSEQYLHRALWLILFLRAMLLHLVLAIAAAALYFMAGMDGLYPVATDFIRAVRAQSIQNRLDGNAFTGVGYIVVVGLLFIAALWFLHWMYRSITQVRRTALRVQAVSMVLIACLVGLESWPQLGFAYERLSHSFAVLATVGVAMTHLIVPTNVALALWRVSRTPERSALIATLDPQLTTSVWTHLNKLLDLPRTPFRTPVAAAAYALALGAAMVLITSVMFLVTVGATGNKLGALAIICERNPELLAQCAAISSNWAWTIAFGFVLALAGVKVAALLRATAKRIGGLNVADVLKRGDEAFLLYLRPFEVDEVILPKPHLPWLSRFFSMRPFPVRIEEELFDVADGYRPMIAIGKPGTRGAASGGVAYRTYLDDSAWQDYVLDKIQRAERIVMVLQTTKGVLWEFDRILDQGALGKTLIFFDPTLKNAPDWGDIRRMVVPALQAAGVVLEDFCFESRPIAFFVHEGALINIVNANWTATSYRTAFSTYLATSPERGTKPTAADKT